MSKLDKAFNRLFPAAEELWHNAEATMQAMQTGPDGHHTMVPHFNPDVVSIDYDVNEEVIRRRGRAVGRTIEMHALTTDGIDREMHLHLPIGSMPDFFIKDGAAWTTRNPGYAGQRAEDIVDRTRIPVLQIGGEHSTERHSLPIELMRLGRTAVNALKLSQSYTAHVEERLTTAVIEEFGLPPVQALIGDSKAKMKQILHYPYAHEYGTEIIYADGKAPCVPDKLTVKDLGKFGRWLLTEVAGGSVVVGQLALEGDLDVLLKTASLSPNFVLSSIIAARALASGEASLSDRVPYDAHGMVVVYDKDGMSNQSRWDEVFANHSNYQVKHVPRGIHASLLKRRANVLQIDRLERLGEEVTAHGKDGIDFTYVRTGLGAQELAA